MLSPKLTIWGAMACFVMVPILSSQLIAQNNQDRQTATVGELPPVQPKSESIGFSDASRAELGRKLGEDKVTTGPLADLLDISQVDLKELGLAALQDLQQLKITAIIRIPGTLIVDALKRDFEQTEPVERVILGTHSRGTAYCYGRVTCDMQENPSRAELVCTIQGFVRADTCGVNGPATINAQAMTSYTAKKPIFFDGRRFVSTPSELISNTRLNIRSIGSSLPRLRGRIVQRVATRRAAESHAQAEAISAAITQRELRQRIDAEFDARIAEMNRKFAARLSLFKFFTSVDEEIAVRSFVDSVEIGLMINPKSQNSVFSERLPTHDSVELWLRAEPVANVQAPILLGLMRYAPQWLATRFSANPGLFVEGNEQVTVTKWNDWLVIQLQD